MTQLPLADHFKNATWDSHTEAETTGLINDILRGKASLENYIRFLQNLYPAYNMMESSSDWLSTFPEMTPFFGDEIHRSRTIESDLEQLCKLSGMTLEPYLPEAQAYASHVQEALLNNHPAMLAHVYVRYLGDLNGGLVLKRLLAKNLELPANCLSFYEFPHIENLAEFRTGFRETLNAITLSEADRQRATQASVDAFKFNVAISNALAPSARL